RVDRIDFDPNVSGFQQIVERSGKHGVVIGDQNAHHRLALPPKTIKTMGWFGDHASMLRAVFTNKAVQFILLMTLWLAGYKLATLLDVFRPYSSLWFLPA